MAKIVAAFWLRRFTLVFVCAAALLVALECFKHGASQANIVGALYWAVITALVAASISAYWAYKHQCKVLRQ